MTTETRTRRNYTEDFKREAVAANSQLSALVVKARTDVKGCFRNADCQLRVHH